MTEVSLESLLVDEDSTAGPAPGDENGPGDRADTADATDGGDGGADPPGRHRPRRRGQWSMAGTPPRRGLLARVRDVLLGRTSFRPAGART